MDRLLLDCTWHPDMMDRADTQNVADWLLLALSMGDLYGALDHFSLN